MRTSAGHAILKFVSVVLLACLLACTTFPVYAERDEGYDEEELWRYDYFLTEQDRLYNSLPHPYLAGYYSEDGSEITITGMKILQREITVSGEPTYIYRKDIVIPDEIDGVPVTAVAASAFEYYADQYSVYLSVKPDHDRITLKLGKNVRHVGYGAFGNLNEVIVGKNELVDDGGFLQAHHISCYKNSCMYQILQTPIFLENYSYGNDPYAIGFFYSFIDESHLISDKVKIDEALNVYLPWGVTKETLGDYVSVDGDARINVLGDTIENGTQIELVNSTYGTIDNTYTVVLEKPQITLTAEPQRTAFAKTTFRLESEVSTTGEPCKLTYVSDNPDVAAVDENGVVTTNKPGTAHITVTAADKYGFSETAVCTVTVRYSWWQWLIRIFLFGWLWY